MTESELELADGRRLHVYDSGGPGPAVFWHHGTPNIGAPPTPLMDGETRWVSYDRPGYGTSTPVPGRDVASAAADVGPWGFDPGEITVPVLLMHGGQDRIAPSTHAEWLAARCPTAELRLSQDDGHISILDQGKSALDWLAAL